MDLILYSTCSKVNTVYLQGAGTYFYNPSCIYEGHWSKDQRSGWGRMEYENGDVYEGKWLEDKHHGQGVLFLGKDRSDAQKNK